MQLAARLLKAARIDSKKSLKRAARNIRGKPFRNPWATRIAVVAERKDAIAVLPLRPSEEDPGTVILDLPDDLELPAAPILVESLREAFSHYPSVIVMAEAVQRIGTAAVQALVAASHHATTTGQRFVIANPSDVMTDICSDLGLGPWLDEWSVK